MLADTKFIEDLYQKLLIRLDFQDKKLDKLLSRRSVIEGVTMLDNQDVCELLKVSKRTLQRYRSSKELPFQMIYHKTYYKEEDVLLFIETQFELSKKNDTE